jgi:hypothetical protein
MSTNPRPSSSPSVEGKQDNISMQSLVQDFRLEIEFDPSSFPIIGFTSQAQKDAIAFFNKNYRGKSYSVLTLVCHVIGLQNQNAVSVSSAFLLPISFCFSSSRPCKLPFTKPKPKLMSGRRLMKTISKNPLRFVARSFLWFFFSFHFSLSASELHLELNRQCSSARKYATEGDYSQ